MICMNWNSGCADHACERLEANSALFQFMQIIGGVRQTAPAWKQVRFAPTFIGESGGATVPSPQGLIVADWRREGATVAVGLRLPRGVTATVELPRLKPEKVTGKKTWTLTLGH